jgi:hypothetical protein
MPNESVEDKKARLLKEIREAKAEGARVEALGREIAAQGRLVQDLADASKDAYTSAPAEFAATVDWERHTASWQSLRTSFSGFAPSTRVITITGMGTTSSTMADFGRVTMPHRWRAPEFEEATTRLFQLHKRPELIEQVRDSMRRLRLDVGSHGRRSPLDLLAEAEAALLRPVLGDGGPTSTLIPLRGCIDETFAVLLKRRQQQEPAKTWGQKLMSVGRQCGYPDVPLDVIGRLADDANQLNDDLSGAKQGGLSRPELSRLFDRGVYFLKTLFTNIDEIRLRPA